VSVSSPTPAQNRPGHPTEIAGRYRILHKIAEGGMGTVYKAEHVLSKKRLAIKVLFPHLCHGPQAIERFRREVSAAAEIDHPGIVQVFDAGVDGDGSFYMAMELLEGDSLAQAMRDDWPTTHRAIDLVRQVLGPLCRAHERGFVHRDLKPENIFLAKDPNTGIVTVKLLDFGLAREVQRKGPTLTGITFGTPEYMSPEQCMSAKKAGTASDVWSMGVLMYELLTGYHPFIGETPNAIMVASIKDPHVPVHDRAPHIPTVLAKIVERCLEKEPDKRPQTAGEVADLLEKALADVTLTDTKPARTHLDDAPPEQVVSDVSLAGIPIGGAENTAAFRENEKKRSERGVSTEPTTTAARAPMNWVVVGGGLFALSVLAVGGAFAVSRIFGDEGSAASPSGPASTDPVSPIALTSLEVVEALSPEVAAVPEVVPAVAPEVAVVAEVAVVPEAAVVPAASLDEPAVEAPPPSAAETAPSEDTTRRDRPRGATSSPERAATTPDERPSGAGELAPEQYTAAQACLSRGDRACAIAILRESRRPRDLARVIDLYEVEGRAREATSAMQSFVRRFPSAPETARYRTELERRGL
jgi:serine/threonine protein kinase